MKHASAAIALLTTLAALSASSAFGDVTRILTFDTDATGNGIVPGTTLSDQYALWGVTFSTPNTSAGFVSGLGGLGSPGYSGWATNTDLTITNSDYYPGTPSPGSNSLRSRTGATGTGGWNQENGDPQIKVALDTPATFFSVTLYGVDYGENDTISGIYAFNNLGTQIGSVLIDGAPNHTIQTLSFAGLSQNISYVVIVPGAYSDFVTLDNITFTQTEIPAPASALVLAGLPLLARRNRRSI